MGSTHCYTRPLKIIACRNRSGGWIYWRVAGRERHQRLYEGFVLTTGQIEETAYVRTPEEVTGGGVLNRRQAMRLLLAGRKLILAGILVGGVLAAVGVLLLKPTYTATATFLPPNSTSSNSSALLSQLGALSGGGLGGGSALGAIGGIKDPTLIYIGILESLSVADDLIGKFDLQKIYKTKKMSSTEKALANHTKFVPGKDTLVKVNVEDHDPKRAADMANAYLAALSKQNDRLALTEAAQRRAFFERQLETQKNQLADAEVDLAKTEEQTGMIHPSGQAQLQMLTIAQTRAAISSREIELEAMSQGATEQNPEMVRLRSEIVGLKAQLAQLENSSAKGSPGNIEVPTSRVPQLTLDYVRREREVKYHETLYELLLRQFESAKLDESRSAPMMQVVDSAVLPDTKSGPPRTLLTLLAAMLGGLLVAAWILGRASWGKLSNNLETLMKQEVSQ
jgi:tyrosine-protein kinase Etk/Wzc